jgi:hypothetical protein
MRNTRRKITKAPSVGVIFHRKFLMMCCSLESYTQAIELDQTNASLYTNRAAASLMILGYKEVRSRREKNVNWISYHKDYLLLLLSLTGK